MMNDETQNQIGNRTFLDVLVMNRTFIIRYESIFCEQQNNTMSNLLVC